MASGVRVARVFTVIRGAILGLVAFGTTGMAAELMLIGHFADASQLIPLVLAGVALGVTGWVAARPGIVSLRALQFVMLTYIGAGLTGITLHFNANAEFQREIDPSIGGMALFWKVVEATAPPALAPGVMVQLGLLGLVYTYKHPALGDEPFDDSAFRRMTMRTVTLLVCALIVTATSASGQVGKSLGVVDANTITEADLLKVPNITPTVAKAILAARPFQSIVGLNTVLRGQGLNDKQTADTYGRIFVHINLNTATAEEIMLIPGAGKRMAHEFEEYRPWKAWAQFDKEIGKYVNAQEVARLAQYGFIPLNLNTASDADLMTIPGVGQRMLREFKEYRPWKTREQFDREIGKYVDQKEVGRLARYVVIP